MYDYTIIGAGPTGLTIAWFLAKYGYKVLMVEREPIIGGCHRVLRVNGLFTEHGPRIYIGNYNAVQMVLNDMGLQFNDIFSKTHINSFNVVKQVVEQLSFKEIMTFAKEYIKFTFNSEYSKHISLKDYLENNNFSEESEKLIDSLTRLTDGSGTDKYTLYEFFEIANQNVFYNVYQPRVPNDVGLFKLWKEILVNTGNVEILLESEVVDIDTNNNLVTSIKIKKNDKILRHYV